MCEQIAQGHFMAYNWLHGIGRQKGVIHIAKNPSDLKIINRQISYPKSYGLKDVTMHTFLLPPSQTLN